ncbi:MAG: hypothetical protein M3S32_00095 [Acidobacteriota bacterium]|nr:hypothetical protein [Acidobacteriota bacterium]
MTGLAIAGAAALLVAALSAVPRLLLNRAQDRLAERRIAAEREPPALLTRAEMVAGRWRRLPGLLGLSGNTVFFEGLFGESWSIATSRIGKIITGRRLASGRLLFRTEVLRIAHTGGEETEFVLTRASASAWRSHLGLWAMAERVRESEGREANPPREADHVSPGRR